MMEAGRGLDPDLKLPDGVVKQQPNSWIGSQVLHLGSAQIGVKSKSARGGVGMAQDNRPHDWLTITNRGCGWVAKRGFVLGVTRRNKASAFSQTLPYF